MYYNFAVFDIFSIFAAFRFTVMRSYRVRILYIVAVIIVAVVMFTERNGRLLASEPSGWRLSLSRSARFDVHDLRGKRARTEYFFL